MALELLVIDPSTSDPVSGDNPAGFRLGHPAQTVRPGESRPGVQIAGTVRSVLPGALYRVELDSGESVVAHVASALRVRVVRMLPGYDVMVELSPYDHRRGRIVATSK